MEVHLGMRGQLILDVGAEINVKVSEPTESESGSTSQEVKISNIAAGGSYKIRGTVVAAFNPNFYNACPTCNKKVEEAEKPSCTEHGEVTPAAAMVLNIVIDDGTGNIRCTAFRNTATIMVGKSAEELKGLGEELTTTVNDALLGTEIEIEGSVRENKMFGRTELLINNFSKPDPKVIVEKLLKSKGE